ncbi:Hypothetical protein, putative [Bodo saltans]|uniref:Uncharacterized protein n=1 Tax=Bodo saltans TaxID=75058 RepID=A0A0S4JID5_BODSA|nr:Hypothetical protein, putative [Bodo saltans]|eukprot:CUG88769.1 Hypothetical protein, putative [Bodo saltans]
MKASHSRAEIVLLQKIFAAGGPVRNLLHVQLTVLHVPWFVPGDKLLAAAQELKLLPRDIHQQLESTEGGAEAIAAKLSAEDMASLLQRALFPGGSALAFTDFLALLSVCKRHYAAWSSLQMSPDALHEAIRYVVEGLGDWKEEDEAGGGSSTHHHVMEDKDVGIIGLVSAHSPQGTARGGGGASWASSATSAHASRTSQEGKSDNLKTYLSWFGVKGDVLFKDLNTDALLRQVQHAADAEGAADTANEFDPMAASSLVPFHKPTSLAQVGTIALGLKRHRASIQRQKELVAQQNLQRQRGSSILAEMLSQAKVTPKGTIHVGGHHGAAPPSPIPGSGGGAHHSTNSKLGWLEPHFPLKGVGPRASMFAMDTPPTHIEWDEHRHRMVAATMRGGAKRLLQQGIRLNGPMLPSLASHRTVADLLRLPQLSQQETQRIERHAIAEQELSIQRSRSAEPLDEAFWRTGGPEKRPLLMARRPPSSLEINYIIDETYRKAKDLGVQTSKADATVERRLADQRRVQSQKKLDNRKSELRGGFTLRENMAQRMRKWGE